MMKTLWVRERINSCHIGSISLRWLHFPTERIHSFWILLLWNWGWRTLIRIITIRSQKVLKNWYFVKSKTFLTQALISLWLKDQPYLKVLSQSCLVIPNLWEPLQVTSKCKKSSWCKTRDCLSLIKTGISINKKLQCLTMTTSNTTSSWVQTCFPRLDSSQTTQKETWNGLVSPSHFIHLEVWNSNHFNAMEDMFHIQVKDELFGEDWLKCFATEILDAKHEKTDVAEIMKGLTHQNTHQKGRLALTATGEQNHAWWNS